MKIKVSSKRFFANVNDALSVLNLIFYYSILHFSDFGLITGFGEVPGCFQSVAVKYRY